MKNKRTDKVDLELRPHHVLGFAGHEAQPDLYSLSDKKYISKFREQKKDCHSDKLILHWRTVIKRLHKNPNLKFKYVHVSDSICGGCENNKRCIDTKDEYYNIAEQWDKYAIKSLPELKFGRIYDGRFLRKLLKKKGWIK